MAFLIVGSTALDSIKPKIRKPAPARRFASMPPLPQVSQPVKREGSSAGFSKNTSSFNGRHKLI